MNRTGTLIDQAYGPNVTNLFHRFNTRKKGEELGLEPRTGPIRSAPVPFAVTGGAPAQVIAAQNANRKGLLIKNLDPTADLFIGFGTLADANGFSIPAGGYVLLDFVCPTDTISVFALVNVRGYLLEMSPS